MDSPTAPGSLSLGYGAKYLMRDRDAIYGVFFRNRVKNMGIKEVISAPRSPWQNPFVERMIGSIRRECTDRVIVLNEAHLTSVLCSYFEYYHNDRTHLSLEKDSPDNRPIQSRPAGKCKIIALPRVGGLASSIRVEKSSLRIKIVMLQPSDDLS